MKFIDTMFNKKADGISSNLSPSVSGNGLSHKARRTMLALESRIVFDGAVVDTVADTVSDANAQVQASADIHQDAANFIQVISDTAPPVFEQPSLAQRTDIFFIDPNVGDTQSIINALPAGAEYHVLDGASEGVAQITAILSDRHNVDSINIVSEGGEGHFVLGTDVIWNETLDYYATSITSWGNALTTNGDIAIYGCDLAASGEGQLLVNRIADMTHADVAASTDLTGATNLGGDWQLEYQTGGIEVATLNAVDFQDTLATFKVTNLNDAGAGSLRAAVLSANGNGTADTIVFDPTLFSAGTQQTITLTSGELDISGNNNADAITIIGAGANLLAISGNNSSRIFAATYSTGSPYTSNTSTATLSGMTLTNGKANATNGWGLGGAIVSVYSGGLSLTNMIIKNSVSIYISAGVGGNGGGGVAFGDPSGNLLVSNSMIYNNIANGSSGAGGLYGFSGTGSIIVQNSSISGNTNQSTSGRASYGGGAILATNGGGSVSVSNTTFYNNTGAGGSGLALAGGSAIVQNSTFTQNHAISADARQSGALWVMSTTTATLNNNILFGNTASGGGNKADFFTALSTVNGTKNIIGVQGNYAGQPSTITLTSTITTNPTLGTLANNGGFVKTVSIGAGGSADNAGSATGAPTTDARGYVRGASIDIGAYEISAATTFNFVGTLFPANGFTDVPSNNNLYIDFGEAITAVAAKNIIIYKSSDNSVFESIPVTDSRVTISAGINGNSKVTINPTGTFASLTGYYVLIDSGAFTDAASKTFNGITSNATWAFTSVVAAANTNPVSSINTGLTVLEDAAITTITTAMLNVTDVEQAASALTYTLTTASTKGVFSKSGAALGVGGTFTQSDINSGIIKYTPNFNGNGSDSVGFSASDGAGGTLSAQTFNFTITPVVDVNIVAAITPVEGATGTFTITLDSAPASNLTINYTLDSASTATLTTDYTVSAGANISAVTAGTFTILAGQTTATLNVNALTDVIVDPNETVILKLATGAGYQLAATSASSFATKVDYTTGVDPRSVTTGDFNGDGKLDLAVANITDNTVSILLGTGLGTFTPNVDYATGIYPFSVSTGDFNGDGKLDLAIANIGIGSISVLLGTGTGTFAPNVDYATTSRPFSVSVGDFNGDGKLDLVAPNFYSSTVSVLLGTGSGTFAAKVDYATGASPYSVSTGDFNGDGKLDLAVVNLDHNSVSVLLGTGSGAFAANVDYVTGLNPYSVSVGDFNGDAKLDLAVANYTDNTVSVLLGTGSGTFAAKVDYAAGLSPISVSTGDFNGDGKLDLVVANYNYFNSRVSVLLGTGSGTFAANVDYAIGAGSFSVSVGDFNGDGKLDLVATTSNSVSVLLNNAVPSATLTITDVNTPPVSSINTGLTVLEDAAITTITTAMLNITDVEQAASALTYTLTTASTKGVLSKSGVALGVGGTFTQADINSGIIKYTPNLNANGSDSVGFSVSDGVGGTLSAQTFTIGITAVNDAPILSRVFVENFDTLGLTGNSNAQYLTGLTTHYNSLLTGWQAAGNSTFHGVEVQTGNWAFMIYADNVGTQIATVAANTSGTTYTVNFDVAPSVHFIAGQASDANDKVDIKVYDASNNLLADYQVGGGVMTANPLFIHKSFTYTGNGNGNIHFVIGSAFPGNNHFAGTIDNISISSQSLTAINEDVLDASNTGNTVASIVVNGSITDVDYSPITSAPESIAVSAVDNTNGVWQYKIGAGAWIAFDFTTNSGKALLLDSADSIRFVPNANWNGTVSSGITFYAWDKTSGSAGSYLTISGNTGGTATLSTATDTASIVVTAVNDAPVASGSATLAAVLEDISTAATGATISSLFAGNFSDVADTVTSGSIANTFTGIAISNYTVDAAKGAWQYKIGAGAWTALPSATTTTAITLASTDSLRFVPAADYNGTATALSANLIESGATITSGGTVDLTATGMGGVMHYSAATVALNHTITAVNDAPTGVGNLTLAAVNENTVSPAGAAINTLTGFSFTDVDTGATLKGVAVVGSGDGNWQYSTNGGTNWYSIGAVGIANTLVLAPTTLVRYLPSSNYIGTLFSLQVKALDDSYAGGFSTTAGAETRVTLDATVNGGATAISNASNTISTSVTDVNPVIANAAVSLNENSAATTAVTTVTATNDTNGLIYFITGGNTDVDGDGNLAFSINASTGAIIVNDAGDLNFETTPSFSLAVAVDDEDADTTADSTATITVNLQNLDEVAPTITSSATATAINENSGAAQVIYTVISTDVGDIATGATAYSLTGTDAGLFTINSSTGAVTLTANPNFEAKSSYSFNVVATDTAGNFSTKAVTLGINNLDEVAPTITSSATATAIDENSGAAQVVYTATSTDVGDIATGATAYSLSGTDAGLFSINSSTGAVSLTTNPNFETKASYSFNVIATDTVGNFSTKAVTLAINDLNEAPSVTSGGTLSVAENSTGTVYTATGTDPDPAQTLSWSISGTDAALFSINSTSGALTFNTVPNFEIPADNGADNVYDLTVIATDNGTGNLTASKAVVITVTNVNEAPTTSAPASISVVEDVASALTGISFADVDAGSSSVTATLAVNSGTLIATSGSGVTVTGSGTASMSLAGTLANINAFIASSAVSFTTALNSIGNVTLSSSLNDNGNSGSGGALSSAVSATILNVTGIADTPSVASLTINEDIDSGAITITRNAADSVEVTHYKITSITGGTLYSDAGFTTAISAGSFIASSGATTNVYFRPIANANTAGSFTVQASTSNADAGLGGTTATSTINITPIADTASVTSSTTTPSTQTTSGLVISRNAVDGVEVTNFKITNIINGTLYQNDGTTQITAGSFITFAQANAGLKFTPSGVSNGSFDVQASTSNVDAGLGGAVSTATISLGISIANANTNEDTGTGAIAITGNTGFYKITGLTGGTLYSDAGFTTPIANDGFITTSGATTNVYFRPAADFNGTAGFTIQGSSSNSDAGLGGNTATSTITVNPVNDAPTGSGNLTLSAVDEDTVSPAGAAINTLAGLNFTDVDAGASLSGVAVIANTANVNTQGVWQYSTNGTNWYNIGTVTGNSAVALSATSLVRFVPALNFNGTPPSLTVRALDNTYAEGFTNGAVLVKTNANINGGSSGISANTNTIDTRIAAVNDAPVWSGLANTVNFTEDSAAVALGSAITLSDVDLNALSYADATLTLVRNGSANTDDVFANTGTLGALTQGGNLTVNGVVIGTVTTNSAGLLTLTFNNNATKALVSSALQQITYSNASNTPPASVQIMWLFNDNNTGAQGKGAALSALRSTTVAITPTNDAPVAVNDSATVVNGGMLSGISLLANDSDPENDTLTVNTTPIINVAHGTLTLYANGSYLYQNDGSAAKTDSFVYEIIDGHGGKAQATITMTINGSPLVNQPTGNVVFLNNLSVFFDNFLTSGSLMLLSNRDNYIESHSRYVFEDKKHLLDHDYHGDYALPSVHLSLYVPLRYHIISVAGVLPTQTLIAQEFYVFKIPNWLFQHRNAYETLKFTATHLDGKALPDWIKLNPKTLTFFGLAPKGEQDVRVMMTIGDQYGNKVHSVFTIHVTDKIPAKNVVGEQRRTVGKSGFSEQLYSAGKVSKLQESRRLLDSLNHL